jgi:hypothetical protein
MSGQTSFRATRPFSNQSYVAAQADRSYPQWLWQTPYEALGLVQESVDVVKMLCRQAVANLIAGGRLIVLASADLRAQLAAEADRHGMTLDEWVLQKLSLSPNTGETGMPPCVGGFRVCPPPRC